MMVKDGDLIAVFNSIHRVMKAEKLLKEQNLAILLIPVPRTLASDCGLAIRYAESDRGGVDKCLADAELQPEEIYRKEGKQYVRLT